MRHAATGLALILSGALSASASPSQPIMVLSYGMDSCGRFVKADESEKQLYLVWALGFISGANIADNGEGRMAGQSWDEQGATVWLEHYCTEHPLQNFFTAASQFRKALGGNLVH